MIEQHIYNLLSNIHKKVIGDLPATQEDAVAIILFDGPGNSEYFSSTTIYHSTVKIIVRNKSYEVAQNQIELIKSTLNRHTDDFFLSILLRGYPLYLGRSDQKLHEFQIVFNIQLKE